MKLIITLVKPSADHYAPRFSATGVDVTCHPASPVNDIDTLQSIRAANPDTAILISGGLRAKLIEANIDLTDLYALPPQPVQDGSPLTLDWLSKA